MNHSERDKLYIILDRILNHSKYIKRDLPCITLNKTQYNTFKKFNDPDPYNNYYYKDILIRT